MQPSEAETQKRQVGLCNERGVRQARVQTLSTIYQAGDSGTIAQPSRVSSLPCKMGLATPLACLSLDGMAYGSRRFPAHTHLERLFREQALGSPRPGADPSQVHDVGQTA